MLKKSCYLDKIYQGYISAKIMLGLGFDLCSAGNQQRELTTSPMTLFVEQANGNTVFDMFVVTLIIGNKFVEPAPR